MAALEFEWPLTPEPVVFFDTAQLSFSSNRPELLFSEMGSEDARFHLSSTPLSRSHGVWTLKTGTRTEEVLRLRKAIPQLDLTAELYLSTGPSRETARLRAGLALALAGVLGLIGAIILQQRRRLALESQHSATLEARVEARTNELQEAQSELIEASKLAALGRLSAGVSHELNQPLAAILNFAENGTQLVVRKRDEEAKGNFSMIADQVRRITRIIGNLRAFAREEVLPTDIVDLSAITEEVMAIVTEDLKTAGVTLNASLPGHPVPVLAGRVRLEQVLLNLFSNAIDAMQTSKRKTLSIKLRVENDNAHLTVRDTGAGIKDLDRVFEPFYSTKELGSSKGLGMGLALSYGIVTKFGGQISCQNTGDGAEFLLTLPLSEAL
jgi:two-component system C4-dicarboxylate transport sensor histidine kinase DctB